MAIIIFTPEQFYASSAASGGGGGGTGSSGLTNTATLSKLATDANGNLLFNGKIIGEKSIEVSYNFILSAQNISQKFIALPNDCDTSRNIVFYLSGLALAQGEFWEVIEKNYPEQDLISWNGLQLEQLVQSGDSACITYYKKN